MSNMSDPLEVHSKQALKRTSKKSHFFVVVVLTNKVRGSTLCS